MEPRSEDINLLDELTEDFVARFRRDEHPSVEEYAAQYPSLADRIREVFPALILLEDARAGEAQDFGRHASPPSLTRDPPIDRLGDYRIVREIGAGGMGVVYEAEQESLGRRVALKLLQNHKLIDRRTIERFQREARTVAQLHHSNIVSVFGAGQHDGLYYHVMQLIPGHALDRILRELRIIRQIPAESREATATKTAGASAPKLECTMDDARFDASAAARLLLTRSVRDIVDGIDSDASCSTADSQSNGTQVKPERAEREREAEYAVDRVTSSPMPSSGDIALLYSKNVAAIGVQVADALAYATSQGILHRDIKPSNLLLDRHGTVWVTDFGLAKLSDSDDLTRTGDIVGTLRYMAPERFEGRSDHLSDIYSLGITLYELLTLRHPFEQLDRHELILRITQDEPVRPRIIDPAIPRDLETVVLKAIARQPADRYPTAEHFAADLRRFLTDQPIHARRVGLSERFWRWSRRNPVVASLSFIVLCLMFTVCIAIPLMYAARVQRDLALQNLQKVAEAERLARASQDRAEKAEQQLAVRNHLAQAIALRQSGLVGQRFHCLDELTQAARLNPTVEIQASLRKEAIRALALTDLRSKSRFIARGVHAPHIDHQFQRYAFVEHYQERDVVVKSSRDHAELLRIPAPEFAFWHAALDFSPNGMYLFITYYPLQRGESNAVLRVWNLDQQRQVFADDMRSGDVNSSVTCHDHTVAYVNRNAELCFWNLRDEVLEHKFFVGATPYNICWETSGTRVAINDYTTPHVQIFDIASGELLSSWKENVGPYGMAWSADGKLLAVADDAGQIFVWNTESGVLSRVLQLEGIAVRLIFANKGYLLSTSNWDAVTYLWDALSGQSLVQADGELIRFASDDKEIVIYCDHFFEIWELFHETEVRSLYPSLMSSSSRNDEVLYGARFSQDGRWLAVFGHLGIWLWDRSTGQEIGHMPIGDTPAVLWHQDGTKLYAYVSGKGLFEWPLKRITHETSTEITVGPSRKLYDLPSTRGFARHPNSIVWSHDQQRIAVVDNEQGHIAVVGTGTSDSGERIPTFASAHRRMTSVAVSADGKWVAAGGWKEKGVQVWRADDATQVMVLPHSPSPFDTRFWVYFTPDNRWLISAADSFGFTAYEVGTWKPSYHLSMKRSVPVSAAFSQNKQWMALTMSGRDVTIAKPEDGSPWLQLPVQQFHYHSFLSDHGTECIIVPEHGPMNWWNLKRLDLQLRELGLAPPNDSTIVGTAATSTSSASLDGEDLDAWSTFPSADRHVVFRIDDGAKQ